MACCYDDECGDYEVSPILVARSGPGKCREEPPLCYPCLPRCQKVYTCEKPLTRSPQRKCKKEDDFEYRPRSGCDHCGEHHDNYCCYKEISPPRPCPARSPRRPPCQPPSECCATYCDTGCKPVRTRYVIPCYRYEDGRIVNRLPVTAFKRNGMQDQEHSKLLGTANFLTRCPQDVSIECDICTNPVKACDPAKVPPYREKDLGNRLLRKKPIKVYLEDIID